MWRAAAVAMLLGLVSVQPGMAEDGSASDDCAYSADGECLVRSRNDGAEKDASGEKGMKPGFGCKAV